jgi:hypothetical protein
MFWFCRDRAVRFLPLNRRGEDPDQDYANDNSNVDVDAFSDSIVQVASHVLRVIPLDWERPA